MPIIFNFKSIASGTILKKIQISIQLELFKLPSDLYRLFFDLLHRFFA